MITKNTSKEEILKIGEDCKRCGECCQKGSGALERKDLKRIADFLEITEEELKKKHLEDIEKFHTTLLRPKLKREEGKPYGVCVFFSKRHGCAIHEVKPLECKIGTCGPKGEEVSQWFMLNYFVNENDPESVREFAVYLKTGGKTLSGGKLEELIPNKELLKKILDYEVLK